MNSHNNEDPEQFWKCPGTKEMPHFEETLTEKKCPKCGSPKPRITNLVSDISNSGSDISTDSFHRKKRFAIPSQQPKKDWSLLFALIILNIGSGFTTIYGAAKIFPQLVGYTTGGAIQILLFLLVSGGSTLKDSPKLKWLVVSAFSIVSVYTSFFAYYDFLTIKKIEKDVVDRATSAHRNLVSEILIPIQRKANELENEIKSYDQLIKDEIEGNRISGQPNCGSECIKLKTRQEELKIKLSQIIPVVNTLKPLFQYDIQGKDPQEIFKSDIKALEAVQPKCLASEPKFVCLPDQYIGSLNPQNPKYDKLRATYFDEDLNIGLFSPFLKIKRGDTAAIGAAVIAILVDGCIILLGLGVEKRQKARRIFLKINGLGSTFLDNLLACIDNATLTIDIETLQKNNENSRENNVGYLNLIHNIHTETSWIFKIEEGKNWQIVGSQQAKDLVSWLVQERSRQAECELKVSPKSSDELLDISIELPIKYD